MSDSGSESPRRRFGRSVNKKKARAAILEALRDGHSRGAAAAIAGIARHTLWRWLKNERFAEDVELAEGQAERVIVDKLLDAAKAGDREAIRMWLRARRRDEWEDGPRGISLPAFVVPSVRMREDEIIEMERRYASARADVEVIDVPKQPLALPAPSTAVVVVIPDNEETT
jgi:hypothetical protein